jgi:hypothetical protein
MTRPRSNPAELYKSASFGLAWSAAIAAMLFAFAYFWLLDGAPAGWFNDFLTTALPGAAVIAITYVIGYYFLIRKGISRDQRLVESFLETLGERSSVAPEVLSFAAHPRDIDWSELLDGAESVAIAARWFDTWSNENFSALTRFFDRAGSMEAILLDPENERALSLASAQHAGFAEGDNGLSARRKVLTGIKRLSKSAAGSPRENPLTVRLIVNPRAVLSQTLMRFEGASGTRLVCYALDNFRDDGHRSPAIVLDLTASHQLREFWESELRGFDKNSRLISSEELSRLAK